MNAIIQLDLFQPKPTELDFMRADIAAIEESKEKCRKKLFAENGALKKRMLELEERLQIIERNICQQ
jgi:hypothetical protein